MDRQTHRQTDVFICQLQNTKAQRQKGRRDGSDRDFGVFKHLPGLLVGALLLQTLPLEISRLELLQPTGVVPPSSDQDVVSMIRIQKDYQREDLALTQRCLLGQNLTGYIPFVLNVFMFEQRHGHFSPDAAQQLATTTADVKKTCDHILDFITESSVCCFFAEPKVQSLSDTPPHPSCSCWSHVLHRDTDKCDQCKQLFLEIPALQNW